MLSSFILWTLLGLTSVKGLCSDDCACVNQVTEPPLIDGVDSGDEWADATKFSLFRASKDDKDVLAEASVFAGCNQQWFVMVKAVGSNTLSAANDLSENFVKIDGKLIPPLLYKVIVEGGLDVGWEAEFEIPQSDKSELKIHSNVLDSESKEQTAGTSGKSFPICTNLECEGVPPYAQIATEEPECGNDADCNPCPLDDEGCKACGKYTCNQGTCQTNFMTDSVVCGVALDEPGKECTDGNLYCNGEGQCIVEKVVSAESKTMCRPKSVDNPCDEAEYCDGINATCPEDEFVADETPCGADPDSCSKGSKCMSGNCTFQGFMDTSTSCGEVDTSIFPCSEGKFCDGSGVCTERFAVGKVCGAPSSECFAEPTCDGTSGSCPAPDSKPKPEGDSCGNTIALDSECDEPDTCDGAGHCLSNNKEGSCGATPDECSQGHMCNSGKCTFVGWQDEGTPCGSPSDEGCDKPDACDGWGKCVDLVKDITFVCRAASGTGCDVEERCDGTSKTCPDDQFAPSDTPCGNPMDSECDKPDTCDGLGQCSENKQPDGTSCGAPPDSCSKGSMCSSGGCVFIGWESEGTPCGSDSEEGCDAADTCDGQGTCKDNVKDVDFTCREATSTCDVPETCDGISKICPEDEFAVAGTSCGNPLNDSCTDPDTCDGEGSCLPNHVPDGTSCSPETECTFGSSCNNGVCAEIEHKPEGTTCGTLDELSGCDAPDKCNGSGACIEMFMEKGTVCREAKGDCDVAETCTGNSAACPGNVYKPEGASCGSSLDDICTAPDTCNGQGTCLENHASDGTECIPETPCTNGSTCNNGVCPKAEHKSSETPCGTLDEVAGCDAQDFCDGFGSCEEKFMEPGTVCREATGDCDVAETCTGTSATCPEDFVKETSFECRASDGICDTPEYCNGMDKDCPVDVFKVGTVCRESTGSCDVEETCSGTSASCPEDKVEDKQVECRASDGVCDKPEFCNGVDKECPIDEFKESTFVCRPAEDCCDVEETCSGSSASCPNDKVKESGIECRASDGMCDIAETCDGVNKGCPADEVKDSTFVCRAADGDCDVAETCNGSSKSCPLDSFKPSGSSCGSNVNTTCNGADTCDGYGTCLDNLASSSTLCEWGDECNNPSYCSNGECPVRTYKSSDTTCGPHPEGSCDLQNTCSNGECVDNVRPATFVCREAAPGGCDIAEMCDGVSHDCPVDTYEPMGTSCGSGEFTECTAPDTCDGSGTCQDNNMADGTSCGTADACNNGHSCSAGTCTFDGYKPQGFECRPSAGECDVSEVCTGNMDECPPDAFKPVDTNCGPTGDQLDYCENQDKCNDSGECIDGGIELLEYTFKCGTTNYFCGNEVTGELCNDGVDSVEIASDEYCDILINAVVDPAINPFATKCPNGKGISHYVLYDCRGADPVKYEADECSSGGSVEACDPADLVIVSGSCTSGGGGKGRRLSGLFSLFG